MQTTVTLTDDEIKQAVAEYLTKRVGWVVKAPEVEIKVDPGEKFYNQFDQGRPASVKISATVNTAPNATVRGFDSLDNQTK